MVSVFLGKVFDESVDNVSDKILLSPLKTSPPVMLDLVDVAEGNDSASEAPEVFEFLGGPGLHTPGRRSSDIPATECAWTGWRPQLGIAGEHCTVRAWGKDVNTPLIFWRTSERTSHELEGSVAAEIWQCRHCQDYLRGQLRRPAWDEHTRQ